MQEVNLAAGCSQLIKFGVQGCLLILGAFLAIAMLSAYSFGCRAMGVITQLLQCSRPSTDKVSQMYLISMFLGAVPCSVPRLLITMWNRTSCEGEC